MVMDRGMDAVPVVYTMGTSPWLEARIKQP